MTQRHDLPTGTVTFLFTDIEGSTRLIQTFGDHAQALFDTHAQLIRGAITAHNGIEVNTDGDAFFCVFTSARDALEGAVAAQRALAGHPWPDGGPLRVRMGIHSGEGTLGGDDYFGIDVHRASRVSDAGNGGQIVLSESTRRLLSSAPDGVTVRDLGMHRLKDLTEPEHLYDLVIEGCPSDFPPLRTTTPDTGALPKQVSSFVGRTRQVDEIVELFETSRFVTCSGPGGVGKTRLAIEVADRLTDTFDDVFFVQLAPLTNPDLVPVTILRTIGIPPTSESARDRLPVVLADKRWLLVLDNFEQVVDAAPIVADMLQAAPDLAVLVTSRTALRIAGEREYVVPPLSIDGADPADAEAAHLFIDRARAVRPDLVLDDDAMAAIMDITRALDGLPLAIELAAARVRILPPTALRQKMGHMLDLLASGSRDLDDRQRTLRGTIRWSYDLLTHEQQRLLEDFSVFRGGASIDTIESVCGISRDYWQWLEDLDALVGHSLVNRSDAGVDSRFTMLEMIREFAAERLDERGLTDEIAEHHLELFLDLAERAAAALITIDQGTWLATLDEERNNLQAALAWAMNRGDGERSARLVFALWRYWHMRGPIPEGLVTTEKVLAMETLTPDDRMLVLEAAGGLAWWAGFMEDSARTYREALELAREFGDETQVANALYNAGLASNFVDPGSGIAMLEEGLEIADRIGNVHLRGKCGWALNTAHQFAHEFQESYDLLLVAREDFRTVGDAFMEQWSNREIGVSLMELDRLGGSVEPLRDALDFFYGAGDLSGILLLLRDHARIAAMRGDMDAALRLLGAVRHHEEESGLSLGQFELEALGVQSPLIIHDEDHAERMRGEGAQWTIDDAVVYARDLDRSADV